MKHTKQSIISKDGVSYLIPFILITSCFALWGFANDITNPMVKAFSKIFRMSATDGALVQVAFYGGYFAMAFPAAMFIRKFSYKAGVLLGLGLYAFGAFLFFPAKMTGESVQTCHGCVPVKVDGCFDDHEQTGAENVNFHLKDTNFMDSCKDFGPNFCLAVSFPIFSY